MDGKISHTTDVLIAPPEAAQPEDSSEQPAGIEVKYPSGRQDAVVMPATVAVGPPHLGGVAPSVVDQCRALSEAMLVMLGPDPRRPPFIRSVANMAALQRLAVYATLGDQLEAIEEATADQRLRDLKRRFESESDPLDRFDLARKIALRLAALGGQGH